MRVSCEFAGGGGVRGRMRLKDVTGSPCLLFLPLDEHSGGAVCSTRMVRAFLICCSHAYAHVVPTLLTLFLFVAPHRRWLHHNQ